MKSRFVKIVIMVVAIVMVAAIFAACGKVEIEVYRTAVRAGNGSGNSGSNNSGSGNGSSAVETPDVDDGGTYNLRIWCAEEDEDMIWDMLNNYASIHSANTYNWTVETQGEDVVSASVMRNVDDAADIFSFANDQIGTLVQNDALAQVPQKYMSQINEQLDAAVTACKIDGKTYAIPYSYENCFLYYNKSILNENEVKSMETLLRLSKKSQYNLGIDMSDSYYTTMFLYTAGVEIFGPNGDDPTSLNLNTTEAKKACEYIAWLGTQKKLRSIVKEDQVGALKTGSVAAMISGPHMITQFKSALGDNFGVAILPTIKLDGENKQLVSFAGVKMYGVSRKADSVRSAATTAEAWRVAAFLGNAENQMIRLEEREFCPTNDDLFSEAVSSNIPTVEVVVNQAEAGCNLKPGIIEMGKYWTPMANFLYGVYTKKKPSGTWSDELSSIEATIKNNS